ncbi:DUF2752 domain-containing protein [Mucilaginibacter flavus]|nr:DUF2752 domain-containing protein [Mucilaginibacter flavus]MDN3581895.1 DUF2752 domain-containing protein [Mucilaginibacter flavus]
MIYLFHGQLRNSFHAHWLGVPAVIVIFYRIYQLAQPRPHLNPLQRRGL